MTRELNAVVKVGGSLLNDPSLHARVATALSDLGHDRALLLVPGGGPLADAVREMDRRMTPGDDVAHWMAILAMDQHAHLLVSCIAGAALVEYPDDVARALVQGRLPVLAPSRWLKEVDPLPHSWSVTSDSVAAWVAGALGVPLLVLIKSVDGPREALVDAYFTEALPSHVVAVVLAAPRIDELESLLA